MDEFRPNDEGHIELTSQVGDLKISIKGPAEKATHFLRKVHWGATNVLILLLLALVPLIWSLPSLLTALSFLCLGLCRRGHRSRAPSLPGQVQPPLTKKKGSRGLGVLASGAALCFLVACAALTGLHKLIYAPATTPSCGPNRLSAQCFAPVPVPTGGSLEKIESSNSVSHSFSSDLEAKTHLSGAGVAEFDTVA